MFSFVNRFIEQNSYTQTDTTIFNLDFINALILSVAVLNTILGFTIFFKNRKSTTNLLFFLDLMAVVFWGLSTAFFRGFYEKEVVLFFYRLAFLFGGLIAVFFYYFSLVFPSESYKFDKFNKYIAPLPFFILAFISLVPNLLVIDVQILTDSENILIFDQFLNIFYIIILSAYFIGGYYYLTKKYLQSQGELKKQLATVISGTSVAVIIGIIAHLILPSLGSFYLNWLGTITVIIMTASIFFSIIKYQLFNIQIIATELFIFILWTFSFVQLLIIDYTSLKIINAFLFIAMIIFGLLLIRSVLKEVEQKKQLYNLNNLKNQFLSFASHQLKNPLAAIRGYVQLMRENNNDITTVENFSNKVYKIIDDLLNLIDVFVNYRKIESGKLDFNFENVDIVALLKELSERFKILANQKGLNFYFESPVENIIIRADRIKIMQVVQNLLDNAIKYTKEGFVKMELFVNYTKKILTIKIIDTGIGIDKETKSKLFEQFNRSKLVRTKIEGVGLGLYIAKFIVEAHQGKIWAESEGEGRGSQFYVELPIIKS